MRNFEVLIKEIDWQTNKPKNLYVTNFIKAENYNAAVKQAKVELREINKECKKNWQNDEAELGISLPQLKCVITKIEEA